MAGSTSDIITTNDALLISVRYFFTQKWNCS